MGADLCGYILVGPKKLSPASIKKARQHVEGIVAKAKRLLAGPAVEGRLEEAVEKDAVLSELLDALDCEDDSIEGGLKKVANMDPKALVDEAVDAWSGGHRDWMDRELPGNPRLKIGVAGDMTWGDGPEEGSAWYIMDMANRMGVLDKLGII